MLNLDFRPDRHLSQKELEEWKNRVENWMLANLEDQFTCDWEYGAEGIIDPANPTTIPPPDFYLYITFDLEEDKVKFILKWG